MRACRSGSTVLAYALFGFAVLLAGVAVVGALLLGIDSETAWSNYLITNTAIGLSAAPCGLLIARAKPDNPIGWLFLDHGYCPVTHCGRNALHVLWRRTRLAAVRCCGSW